MPMCKPAHPGVILRAHMGTMTVSELAKHLKVTRANLSMILNGRAGISPLMSLKLDEAFGKSEGLWTRLQMSYDLARVRRMKRTKVKPLAMVKKPVSPLRKGGSAQNAAAPPPRKLAA